MWTTVPRLQNRLLLNRIERGRPVCRQLIFATRRIRYEAARLGLLGQFLCLTDVARASLVPDRSISLLPNDFELRSKVVDKDAHRRSQTPLCHEHQVDRDALRVPSRQNAHETPFAECARGDLAWQ